MEPTFIFTGGVSNNIGMKLALKELLGVEIGETKMDPTYAGALGASIYAHKYNAIGYIGVNAESNLQSVK
ncbi:MAG TPA: hypothetical protein PKA28_14255 [Methylomusa anaerophila]|nr:hypothetical protein [Methylomusa anaerophila]HML89602.1 hypothetical protein [Methylomusa anaerophila]